MSKAEPAQDQGTGTVTVDGETQSFTVARCNPQRIALSGRKRLSVSLEATSEAGNLFFNFNEDVFDKPLPNRGRGEAAAIVARQTVNLRPAGHKFEGDRQKIASDAWEYASSPIRRPASIAADVIAPGPSFQIDGSSLTASGEFKSRITGTDHVVEVRVEGASCLLP